MTNSLEERIQIMIRVGKRFNKIAVPALIILIITGLYKSQGILGNPHIFETSYGVFLGIKIILVVALVITYAIHVRIIRHDIEKKILSHEITEPEIQKLRKKIIIIGEVTVVLSVAILFFAALLDARV